MCSAPCSQRKGDYLGLLLPFPCGVTLVVMGFSLTGQSWETALGQSPWLTCLHLRATSGWLPVPRTGGVCVQRRGLPPPQFALSDDPGKPDRRELLCMGEELSFSSQPSVRVTSSSRSQSSARPRARAGSCPEHPSHAPQVSSISLGRQRLGSSTWQEPGEGLSQPGVQLNRFGDMQLPHQLQHPHCCAQRCHHRFPSSSGPVPSPHAGWAMLEEEEGSGCSSALLKSTGHLLSSHRALVVWSHHFLMRTPLQEGLGWAGKTSPGFV